MRWRIAALFVVLSSVVYVASMLLSVVLFHAMMLQALDNELRVLASTFGRAIGVRGSAPYFRDWMRIVQTEPNRSIASIQLYDTNKRLLESYGPKRHQQLVLGQSSLRFSKALLRLRTTQVIFDSRVVGYLQLELPTDNVEEATRQFALTMALTAPLVLAGLGASALVVSGQVARPFVENLGMLRRFIADAGHELNTPLSIVQARTESLAKKLDKQGFPIDELATIETSLERMSKIVKDLMLLTEVEGALGTRAPHADVDLGALVVRTVEEFRDRYRDKGLELKHDAAPCHVTGYPDAIQKLLSNLLENALRYTESGGSVMLSVKPGDRQVQVIVEDTGIGIPSASLPFIFDRFYRVDKSRSRASGGVGLGLSIVKAIAEAHRGHVSVESVLNSGTKFIVTLPTVG